MNPYESTRSFDAIIFDCDGVLVDSEPHSCYAWNVLFQKKFKVDIGTDYSPVLGKSGVAAAQHYCSTHQIPWTEDLLQLLSLEKEEIYYSLARNNLKAMSGVIPFIQKVKTLGYKIAVASSGTREKIMFNLQESGLWALFETEVIIDSSMVEHGKPDPSIFLTTALHLGVNINRCAIIEDSVAGIQAAKHSGGFAIALTSTFPPARLHKADILIDKFSDLGL